MNVPHPMLQERQRQISGEGWSPQHDDRHSSGELLLVATMYYRRAIGQTLPMRLARPMSDSTFTVPIGWPWESSWWKPKTPTRDLERAGALCLAEIDRLKRKGRPVEHVEETLGLIVSAYEARIAR